MKPTKVIYDTDPGVDDAMALLFIEASPAIDLVGITTVFGNSPVETTTFNALYLKDRFRIAAPVARGAGSPLVRDEIDTADYVHGSNGLGEIDLPKMVGSELDPRPAHRFIIDTVRAHPGEITLLGVGRMTNLALALREDPEIATLVERVVIMGGAFGFHGHSGNVTPVAEANIAGDPHAADEIFAAPWEVVVIGLDVTQETVMTSAYLADLRDRAGEAGRFIWDISRFYETFYRDATGIDGIFGHDFSAAASDRRGRLSARGREYRHRPWRSLRQGSHLSPPRAAHQLHGWAGLGAKRDSQLGEQLRRALARARR